MSTHRHSNKYKGKRYIAKANVLEKNLAGKLIVLLQIGRASCRERV